MTLDVDILCVEMLMCGGCVLDEVHSAVPSAIDAERQFGGAAERAWGAIGRGNRGSTVADAGKHPCVHVCVHVCVAVSLSLSAPSGDEPALRCSLGSTPAHVERSSGPGIEWVRYQCHMREWIFGQMICRTT